MYWSWNKNYFKNHISWNKMKKLFLKADPKRSTQEEEYKTLWIVKKTWYNKQLTELIVIKNSTEATVNVSACIILNKLDFKLITNTIMAWLSGPVYDMTFRRYFLDYFTNLKPLLQAT